MHLLFVAHIVHKKVQKKGQAFVDESIAMVKRYVPVNRIWLRVKYFNEQPALGASNDLRSI